MARNDGYGVVKVIIMSVIFKSNIHGSVQRSMNQ